MGHKDGVPEVTMVAHLIIAQCQPGRCEDFIEPYRDRVMPLARSSLGYRGMYLLADRASGKALALSLWDTADDAAAFEQQQVAGKEVVALPECLVEPTRAQLYEVSVQA